MVTQILIIHYYYSPTPSVSYTLLTPPVDSLSDEKSDDQESKDSLMTRFVNNMADSVDTAHKLWNEAQSKK